MTDEFDWTGFENTRNVCEPQSSNEDEPEQGNRLLKELAELGVLDEREPGRYYVSKLRPDRDKLS